MISIEKCRELIPDSDKYTDEQITEIRDSLQQFAELALDHYFDQKATGKRLSEEGRFE